MNTNEMEFSKNSSAIKKIVQVAFHSNYYHKLFEQAGIHDVNELDYQTFQKIPITTKNDYDNNKYEMFACEIPRLNREEYEKIKTGHDKLEYLTQFGINFKMTSGSTGQPLEIFKSKKDNDKDYCILNFYRHRLTKYNFRGRYIWIWPMNPVAKKYYAPDNELELVKDMLYGSVYTLYEHSDENFERLYQYIIEHDFEWMTTSPNVLYNLAMYIEKKGLAHIQLKYIECHSEKLYDWQKEVITKIFGVTPVSIYSSNEVQFMAATCECGNLHLFSNSCYVEFIENELGGKDLIVTSLNYMDLPIIRYKLGDCGDWVENVECTCKLRKLPIIKLEGFRKNDYLVGKDNKRVEPFVISDSIFFFSREFSLDIKKYKVKQLQVDHFVYYFESNIINGCIEQYENFLKELMKMALGYEVKLEIRDISSEPALLSGYKYKIFENCIKE